MKSKINPKLRLVTCDKIFQSRDGGVSNTRLSIKDQDKIKK